MRQGQRVGQSLPPSQPGDDLLSLGETRAAKANSMNYYVKGNPLRKKNKSAGRGRGFLGRHKSDNKSGLSPRSKTSQSLPSFSAAKEAPNGAIILDLASVHSPRSEQEEERPSKQAQHTPTTRIDDAAAFMNELNPWANKVYCFRSPA
jgi:hypothetical protein